MQEQEAEVKLWTVRQRRAFLSVVGVLWVAGCVFAVYVGVWLVNAARDALFTHTTHGWTAIAKSGDGMVEFLVEDGTV